MCTKRTKYCTEGMPPKARIMGQARLEWRAAGPGRQGRGAGMVHRHGGSGVEHVSGPGHGLRTRADALEDLRPLDREAGPGACRLGRWDLSWSRGLEGWPLGALCVLRFIRTWQRAFGGGEVVLKAAVVAGGDRREDAGEAPQQAGQGSERGRQRVHALGPQPERLAAEAIQAMPPGWCLALHWLRWVVGEAGVRQMLLRRSNDGGEVKQRVAL